MNYEILSIENAKKIAKYEKVLKVIKKQKDEINKLKNIINKALEYMNRRDLEWGSDEHEKMQEILKGETNEKENKLEINK